MGSVGRSGEERERRCGWEVFAEFYSHLLGFALVVLAGLWLMVVQNVYLRANDAADIFSFIVKTKALPQQFVFSVNDLPKGIEAILGWTFGNEGFLAPGKKVEVGAVLVGLVSFGSIAASVALLGDAARKSRQTAEEHIREVSHEIHETQHTTTGRLELMEIWPVAWISELPLLAIMAFFLLSLIWYRLIVLIAILMFFIRLPSLIDLIGKIIKEILQSAFRRRNGR